MRNELLKTTITVSQHGRRCLFQIPSPVPTKQPQISAPHASRSTRHGSGDSSRAAPGALGLLRVVFKREFQLNSKASASHFSALHKRQPEPSDLHIKWRLPVFLFWVFFLFFFLLLLFVLPIFVLFRSRGRLLSLHHQSERSCRQTAVKWSILGAGATSPGALSSLLPPPR